MNLSYSACEAEKDEDGEELGAATRRKTDVQGGFRNAAAHQTTHRQVQRGAIAAVVAAAVDDEHLQGSTVIHIDAAEDSDVRTALVFVPTALLANERGAAIRGEGPGRLAFLPSIESRPERMHSFRPVPRMMAS